VAGVPASFPAHQAAVLPLKVWRPAWFDGVALVLGAASPDLAYALDGSGLPVFPLSHQWLGLLLWCLPVTLLGCWLTRWAAPVVSAHLPTWLRDYAVLGRARPCWWLTASSAVLAAATHLIWDDLATQSVAEDISDAIGALFTLAVLVHIGRTGLLRRWHPAVPPTGPRRPALFWSTAGIAAAVGVAVTPALPGAQLSHTTGVRLLCALAVGLLAGVLAVRLAGPARAYMPADGH
jgi:hypothetical protein